MVWEFTWVKWLKVPVRKNSVGDVKQHYHFLRRKPLAFCLCWVSFTLVKLKTFATLPLSPDAGKSVSSLMLGSSLDRRPRWTQEAFRSSSNVVCMPYWHLSAFYHCCQLLQERGSPLEQLCVEIWKSFRLQKLSLRAIWTSKLQHGLGKILQFLEQSCVGQKGSVSNTCSVNVP